MGSGWVSSPDGRGTFNILASCLTTTFLCCWTSVCPNVPALSDGVWAQFRDKLDLACIGMLGPEFLLLLALGQRTSARRSVRMFREAGFSDWSLKHAFFADMGGFVLQASDLSVPIPVDAEQLLFLVKNGYVDKPMTSKEEIEDKNKADKLVRLLSTAQALWFAASFVARIVVGLAATTMELTTISFVVVFFATSFLWFHKPSSISRPIILHCKTSIVQIRNKAGFHDFDDYRRTPLDFINQDYYIMEAVWMYYINILRQLRIPLFSRPIESRPHNRFESDRFVRTEFDLEHGIWGSIILMFGAIFMCGWNFPFPTPTERIIWHAASICMICYCVLGEVWTVWVFQIYPRRQPFDSLPVVETTSTPSIRRDSSDIELLADKLRGVTSYESRELKVPLRVLIPVTLLCMSYLVARSYILIEDIIGLRDLPPDSYATVNWTKYVPHI